MAGSIPSLYPLDARNTHTPVVKIKKVSRHCQMFPLCVGGVAGVAKSLLVENCWFRVKGTVISFKCLL